MSTTGKIYGVVPITEEPIEFVLGGETFHVTRKPRLDLVQAMARAVTLDKGFRSYDINILTHVVREMLIRERRDPQTGEWRTADDIDRFDALCASDRVMVPTEVFGELAMDLMKEVTAHPTGGSGPSSAGPTQTPSGSKDDSAPLVLP